MKNIISHLLRYGNDCERQRVTARFDEIDDLFVCGSLNVHSISEIEDNLIIICSLNVLKSFYNAIISSSEANIDEFSDR
jgi:hypothetical protein